LIPIVSSTLKHGAAITSTPLNHATVGTIQHNPNRMRGRKHNTG
jgi:hypothetical protein